MFPFLGGVLLAIRGTTSRMDFVLLTLLVVTVAKYAECQTVGPRITTKPSFVDEKCCNIPVTNRQRCFVDDPTNIGECYRQKCCFVNNDCFRPLTRPCGVASVFPAGPAAGPAAPKGKCDVAVGKRIDCGYPGIQLQQCEIQGCCYSPSVSGGAECFFSVENAPRVGPWTPWTLCPAATCATEKRSRSRICLYKDGKRAPNVLCKDKMKETEKCTCGGPPPADDGKVCKDSSDTCGTFRSLCDSSPSFKNTLCTKTCGQCGKRRPGGTGGTGNNKPPGQGNKPPTVPKVEECKDEFSTCSTITHLCEDTGYEKDMIEYCPVTCNLCEKKLQGNKAKAPNAPTVPTQVQGKVTTPPSPKPPKVQGKVTTPPSGFTVTPGRVRGKVTTAPTTPTQPPPTVPPEEECEDQHQYCASNADLCNQGSPSDILFMRETCRKTCKTCDGAPGPFPTRTMLPDTPPPTQPRYPQTPRPTQPRYPQTPSPTRPRYPQTPPPTQPRYPQTPPPTTTAPYDGCDDTLDICAANANLCGNSRTYWDTLCPRTCRTPCPESETQKPTPYQPPRRRPQVTQRTQRPETFFVPPTNRPTTPPIRRTPPPTVSFVKERPSEDCRDKQLDCQNMKTFCTYGPDEEIGQTVRETCPVSCGLCTPSQGGQPRPRQPDPPTETPAPATAGPGQPPSRLYTYSQWSLCSTSCGMGTKTRMKLCFEDGERCEAVMETETCSEGQCIAAAAPVGASSPGGAAVPGAPGVQPAVATGDCTDADTKWCERMKKNVDKFCANKLLSAKCKATCTGC